MDKNLALPHEYEVTTGLDLPSGDQGVRLMEYSPPHDAVGRASCLVGVDVPDSGRWIGRFVGDYEEPPAISVVVSTADPRRVCVVCSGRGYIVDTRSPDQFDVVSCFPVCTVKSVADRGIVLFANFTDLVAYGSTGVTWEVRGIVSDELNVIEVRDDVAVIDGFDAPSHQTVRLAVDLQNGSAQPLT
jgi:hypothetical protein